MSNTALFVTLAYLGVQLVSNISSIKVGAVFDVAVDMGVFLYPLSFTLRDLVHRELGRALTARCVCYTVLINLLMVGYFAFISLFPADASSPVSLAFDNALAPVWRIVVFSLLAQLVSELIDTQVYHVFEKRFKERHKWGRVLFSNSVSIPVDNAIFCIGAFAYVYEWAIVWEIFLFNFVVKYVVSLLSVPLIYLRFKGKRGEAASVK